MGFKLLRKSDQSSHNRQYRNVGHKVTVMGVKVFRFNSKTSREMAVSPRMDIDVDEENTTITFTANPKGSRKMNFIQEGMSGRYSVAAEPIIKKLDLKGKFFIPTINEDGSVTIDYTDYREVGSSVPRMRISETPSMATRLSLNTGSSNHIKSQYVDVYVDEDRNLFKVTPSTSPESRKVSNQTNNRQIYIPIADLKKRLPMKKNVSYEGYVSGDSLIFEYEED